MAHFSSCAGKACSENLTLKRLRANSRIIKRATQGSAYCSTGRRSNVGHSKRHLPRTLQAWSETTPLIARAAIVHGHKWSRHAALIAALLRMRNAEVRSFRPSDCERAIAWLDRGLQSMGANEG